MYKYWVIEHPTRGVYMESNCYGNKTKHRFKWSGLRSDGYKYYSIKEGKSQMDKFPIPLKKRCYLVAFPGGQII